MRVRNQAAFSVFYPFAGVDVDRGRLLQSGALSPKLPANRFYDARLQKALSRGLITVEFDEEDTGMIGVGGLPGPFAEVLSALHAKAEEDGKVVKKPIVVSKPVSAMSDERPKRRRKSARTESLRDGEMRAKDLAQELKVPFHVVAAALEKESGKRFYPFSGVSKKDADAMREKYGEKFEIPELSDTARVAVNTPRTLADIAAESDGLLSLSDLVRENEEGGSD